ncbi:MAG: hypothetical protein HY711_07485, partial [Candidatus Melainabacteria bacterium]|nr:hypothetical protein [Candidatus Melainabacteria bacterium]
MSGKIRLKSNCCDRGPGQVVAGILAIVLIALPYFLFALPALAQTKPTALRQSSAPANDNNDVLAEAAKRTQDTVPESRYARSEDEIPLVQEAAEQNKDSVIYQVEQHLRGEPGDRNQVYMGLHQWFADDWVSNLFANAGKLIAKWISEFIEGWVSDIVQFLTAFLKVFVLNPNIPVNGFGPSLGQPAKSDDISPWIRQGADVMYGIAVDLLLLLFILCIWKYWADAAWRGGSNLMGAVGRLIFTAGLLLAWPTIYAFEIQITNEMIKAIFFNSTKQLDMLDVAMASAVKGGLIAGAAGLAHVLAPVAGAVGGGIVATELGGIVVGTAGEVVAFAGLVIFLVLGGILIAELIYLLVLKAIQTALLTAQYMFFPIFIVFFATPDTENVTSGYVKSFVEVSLWTFVWVGLLKIMVIILFSDFNPWGKIVMAVGILQLMIQVPSFLARAQISPMSDFISAGLITGFALKGAMMLGGQLGRATNRVMDHFAGRFEYALGAPQSKATDIHGLPDQAANPTMLNDSRAAATGKPLLGRPDTGAPEPPLKRAMQGANAASPGLNVPGQAVQLSPEEQARQREAQEQAEAAKRAGQQAQANLGGTGAPAGTVPPGAQQPATAGLTTAGTPGAMNNPPGTPHVGTLGALGRTLSPAGIGRGAVDATTTRVPAGMQRLGLLATMKGFTDDPTIADNPAALDAETPPSGVIDPARRYNQALYKFVQMKTAAVDARTYNGNSIGYSNDGQNKLVGDAKGNLRHMRVRKGANPEEIAHLVAAGGFTELFKEDAEAFDAARESAMAAGEAEPKTLGERMAAGWLGYNGGSFRETAVA